MDITIILLIVNVFAAVAVIGLTLIQQPKGDMGSAFGGGGSQSMFGSRGSANFLTKSTSWMCFVFFASSLTLAYMYAQKNTDAGVVDQSVIEEVTDLPEISASASVSPDSDGELPSIPVDEAKNSIDAAVEDETKALESIEEGVSESTQELEKQAESVVEPINAEINQ